MGRGGGAARRTTGAWLAALALAASPAAATSIFGSDIKLLPDNTPDAAEQAAIGRAPGDPPWKLTGLVTLDALDNARGGLRRGFRVLNKVAVAAAYDAGGGWSGLVSGQYVNGTLFSGHLVGDTQTVSNIEAVGGVRVYEVWLAHAVPGGRLKFGLTDLNADFDVQTAGGLFINSSDGIAAEFSHTGRNGPAIFPTTALALTVGLAPAKGWLVNLGAFDGVPGDPTHPARFSIKIGAHDGALLVGQVTRKYDSGLRLEAGAWAYTAAFPALDRLDAAGAPERLRTSHGAYGLVEGRLYGAADADSSLIGWVRLGIADDRVDRIDSYAEGGLVLTKPFGGRGGDSAGISVMRAMFGDPARNVEPGLRSAETTIEATYRAALMPRVAIQPDVQYVIHPGGTAGLRDALVVGVRLSLGASYAPSGRRKLTDTPR
ncbi:carbohydrate porin [Sphingosinicellaceae bacterium]|nr:carbohydrate porin [Sphingosinicellaceae bacterium]